MTRDTSKGKTILPVRLKSFVRDVKLWRKDSKDGGRLRIAKLEENSLKQEQLWETESSQSPTPEQPRQDVGLSVQLSLNFEFPLEFSYRHVYNSSPDFVLTEELNTIFLDRLDNCFSELISRKDPCAPQAVLKDGRSKTRVFDIAIQINRHGFSCAKKTYTSYQRDPVNAESAKQLVISAHQIVSLFIKLYDPGYVYKDGPIHDEPQDVPETSPYRCEAVQPMNCIPRRRFLEQTQDFETTPGFSLDVVLTGHNQNLEPCSWSKEIRVESTQTAPLTLTAAETLFSDASYSLEGVLRSRKKIIHSRHLDCTRTNEQCAHVQDGALHIRLQITNNLGPTFAHLERNIHSKLALLGDPGSQDHIDSVDALEQCLGEARDDADDSIGRMNDFDFSITELRGHGWTLEDPLVFSTGSSQSHSRRSIEAILERAQSGIADVLRGNATSVRMHASKRGHHIFDKTLVMRGIAHRIDSTRSSAVAMRKTKIADDLKNRIERDMQMISKTSDVGFRDSYLQDPAPSETGTRDEHSPCHSSAHGAQIGDSRRQLGHSSISTSLFLKSAISENETTSSLGGREDSTTQSSMHEHIQHRQRPDNNSNDNGRSFKPPKLIQSLNRQSLDTPKACLATQDMMKHDDSDTFSAITSTPSLVFGAGHSARSSLLMTPKAHGSSIGEVEPAISQGSHEIFGQNIGVEDVINEMQSGEELTRKGLPETVAHIKVAPSGLSPFPPRHSVVSEVAPSEEDLSDPKSTRGEDADEDETHGGDVRFPYKSAEISREESQSNSVLDVAANELDLSGGIQATHKQDAQAEDPTSQKAIVADTPRELPVVGNEATSHGNLKNPRPRIAILPPPEQQQGGPPASHNAVSEYGSGSECSHDFAQTREDYHFASPSTISDISTTEMSPNRYIETVTERLDSFSRHVSQGNENKPYQSYDNSGTISPSQEPSRPQTPKTPQTSLQPFMNPNHRRAGSFGSAGLVGLNSKLQPGDDTSASNRRCLGLGAGGGSSEAPLKIFPLPASRPLLTARSASPLRRMVDQDQNESGGEFLTPRAAQRLPELHFKKRRPASSTAVMEASMARMKARGRRDDGIGGGDGSGDEKSGRVTSPDVRKLPSQDPGTVNPLQAGKVGDKGSISERGDEEGVWEDEQEGEDEGRDEKRSKGKEKEKEIGMSRMRERSYSNISMESESSVMSQSLAFLFEAGVKLASDVIRPASA